LSPESHRSPPAGASLQKRLLMTLVGRRPPAPAGAEQALMTLSSSETRR